MSRLFVGKRTGEVTSLCNALQTPRESPTEDLTTQYMYKREVSTLLHCANDIERR